MHLTALRCHSLHLRYVHLNPAASRHFQASRYLPHTSLLYSASPFLPDDCLCLLQPLPALSVPHSLCVKTVLGVPVGRRGCICKRRPPHLPISPSPSCMRCCWRLPQGWHPTRLLRKGQRSPRHQPRTSFLLLFLSVMDLPLPRDAGTAAGVSL